MSKIGSIKENIKYEILTIPTNDMRLVVNAVKISWWTH